MSAPIAAFFDTSVLIAASDAADPRHVSSRSLLAAARQPRCLRRPHAGRGLRGSLAHRPPEKIPPPVGSPRRSRSNQAGRCHAEHRRIYRDTAPNRDLGLSGGIMFDALLLACARKVDAAENLYLERKALPPRRPRPGRPDHDAVMHTSNVALKHKYANMPLCEPPSTFRMPLFAS